MMTEQIYAAINELILILKDSGHQKLASVLEHRMYKVSWTSSSELLEDIVSVLEKFIREQKSNLDEQIARKIMNIIKAIQSGGNERVG